MAEFVMELYLPGAAADERLVAATLAQGAAAGAKPRGTQIRYLGSIFIPSDETCFHLFDAHSLRAVEEAGEQATLRFERIVASVRLGPSDLRRAAERLRRGEGP